jgi:pimeloyl-ACP methyl ester carboxylesterase
LTFLRSGTPTRMASLMAGTVNPAQAQLVEQLVSFVRLIRLDMRGIGVSDPLQADGAPPLEQQVSDLLAVMDTVGSDRAALRGSGPVHERR